MLFKLNIQLYFYVLALTKVKITVNQKTELYYTVQYLQCLFTEAYTSQI